MLAAQHIGATLASLPGGNMITHRKRVVPIFMWVGGAMRVAVLGIAIAGFGVTGLTLFGYRLPGFLPNETVALWTIGTCLLLFGAFNGMQSVAFQFTVSKLIPMAVRGRLMGFRNFFAGIVAAAVAYMGGGYFIEHDLLGNGYASTFFLAFILTAIGLLGLKHIREPEPPRVQAPAPLMDRLRDLPRQLRTPGFQRYLVGSTLASLAIAAAPFYILHVKEQLNASGQTLGGYGLGVLTISFMLLPTFVSPVWGMLGDRFGIASAEPETDFRKVAKHMRNAAAASASDRSAERLGALGVMVLRANARFTDRRTLAAGDRPIRASHFVIATGAVPVAMEIAGLDSIEPLFPDMISMLTRLPGRLVVAGSGPYAPAFAQAFRRLGSEVALVTQGATLADEEPEHATLVLEALRAEGVTLREHAQALEVSRRGKTGVRVHVKGADGTEETFDATHLLALPRTAPALDWIDADAAGIALSPGGIAVDAAMRTTNSRVFAIGDATGQGGSVQRAEEHASVVVDTVLRRKRGAAPAPSSPRAVFTSPQIAAVGLSEREARLAHREIRILRWPVAENDLARAGREATGSIKIIATVDGRVLGASIAAGNAGELIDAWALAITHGIGVAEMARHAALYPSHGEIGKRAAMSYFAQQARKTGLRRFIPFLR